MIGFAGGTTNFCFIDDMTVKADRDNDGDGTYEVSGLVEHVDDFSIDSQHTPDLEPEYDDAGNMTYDGNYVYTYDAWNRMVKIEKAFRDPGNNDALTKGSIVGQFRYDGLGRRIMKKVTNMVAMDGTFYYYYDNQRPIETRVVMRDEYDSIVAMPILKQQVWGAPGSSYVDELVQIAINQDPQNADVDGDGYEDTEDENICERFFYVMQDANYNVLGLTSAAGQLVERYEYTPYGQRTIHSHGWIRADLDDDGTVGALDLDAFGDAMNGNPDPDDRSDLSGNGQVATLDLDIFGQQWGDTLPSANDPLVMYPRYRSFRNTDGHGDTQATPLCEFGHQGLIHDEEFMVTGTAGSSLIYNRARTLNPGLARFMQRDPISQTKPGGGYQDGMGLYEYVRSNPLNKYDPTGNQAKSLADKIENRLFWRYASLGFIPGVNPLWDSWFGETYEFQDELNEMPWGTVGHKMNDFYTAILNKNKFSSGWMTINIEFQSAKDLVGQFKYPSGKTFSLGWWLHGSHDVRAHGRMQACKEGDRYYVKNLDVAWQWHDEIDGHSFVEAVKRQDADDLLGKAWKAAGNPAVYIEGFYDLSADKLLDIDYYFIIHWQETQPKSTLFKSNGLGGGYKRAK